MLSDQELTKNGVAAPGTNPVTSRAAMGAKENALALGAAALSALPSGNTWMALQTSSSVVCQKL